MAEQRLTNCRQGYSTALRLRDKHWRLWPWWVCAPRCGSWPSSRMPVTPVVVVTPCDCEAFLMVTDYMVNNQVTRIAGAVAESPVPEPSTVLLLGSRAQAAPRGWPVRHSGR